MDFDLKKVSKLGEKKTHNPLSETEKLYKYKDSLVYKKIQV